MYPRRKLSARHARSFWIGAANFYVLAAAIAIGAFFLALGLFHDGSEPAWIPAGISASTVLVAAVILRRAMLKKAQMRVLAARELDRNWRQITPAPSPNDNKLTIEQNASILLELKRKSEAAMVLAKYADGHREVFELCGQYLEINQREMRTVGAGSPRIAALRRGRQIAEDYHRQHMLKWAEIEARSMLEDAQQKPKPADKIEVAGRALVIVDSALKRYPDEQMLADSSLVISDFITKVRVGDLIDRAGRAEGRGNLKQAQKLYYNALAQLETNGSADADKAMAVEKIRSELERLTQSDLK
jgi:hypothetical protein